VPPHRVIPLLPPPFPIQFYIFSHLCFLRVQKTFSKKKKKKEKEKIRKHFVGHLHPRLPSASPMPLSAPPLISAPQSSSPIILHCSAPRLSYLSSHPPAPCASLSTSFIIVFFFFLFFFYLAIGGSVMLLHQVCQCSPACVPRARGVPFCGVPT
jgi:hypothetical protein